MFASLVNVWDVLKPCYDPPISRRKISQAQYLQRNNFLSFYYIQYHPTVNTFSPICRSPLSIFRVGDAHTVRSSGWSDDPVLYSTHFAKKNLVTRIKIFYRTPHSVFDKWTKLLCYLFDHSFSRHHIRIYI